LRDINKTLIKIKNLFGIVNLNEISEIEKDIDTVRSNHAGIKEKKDQIKQKENLNSDLKKQIIEMDKKISEIKNSKDYDKYKKIIEKRKKSEEDLRISNQDIKNEFLPISKLMKKFEHTALENTELIKKYNNDPSKALRIDEDFIIKNILLTIKNNILEDKFDLKGKNKDKFFNQIDNLFNKINPFYEKIDALEKSRISVS